MGVTRREFVKSGVAGGLAAGPLAAADGPKTALPTRVLGKTGMRVSILAMGGGNRFLQYRDEDKALEALRKALDLGITYIDTSDSYGNHLSEERIGKGIKGRREGIFLATKVTERKGAETARIVEKSLKSLSVDRIDLVHIHSLSTAEDLALIESRGGVLEQLMKLRDQKLVRFIGITSHSDPVVLKTALERHPFDCTQMALNGAMLGMRDGPGGLVPNALSNPSFQTVALPVANRKNIGVIAMKIFAQDALTGQATAEKLLYYSLSLPVAAAVVGMPKLEHIEENVRLVKAFRPLPAAEMQRLSQTLSARNKASLDLYFRSHVDG
jgi:aryl-alcohol dehydrogenase-like predicted oxidoreductase